MFRFAQTKEHLKKNQPKRMQVTKLELTLQVPISVIVTATVTTKSAATAPVLLAA
jgi:hypothetical protein